MHATQWPGGRVGTSQPNELILSELTRWDADRQCVQLHRPVGHPSTLYWTEHDGGIIFAAEPDGVEGTWRAWAARETASPKRWMDSWLAAFAIQSGCQIVTLDKGFAQFEGLNAMILGLDR